MERNKYKLVYRTFGSEYLKMITFGFECFCNETEQEIMSNRI